MNAISTILPHYPDIRAPYRIARISKGHVNQIWLIESNKNKYVLKTLNKDLSFGRVRFITESQEYLFQSINSSPRIYKNKKGELFHHDANGYYIVSLYIGGETNSVYDLGDQAYYAIGAFLGRVHASYQNFVLYSGCSRKMSLRRSPQSRIKDLIEYHEKIGQDEFCLDVLRYKYKELERFPEDYIERFFHLPKQVIHGDFYIDNLLFDENKEIVALVDYDQSCRFFKVYELMRAMVFTIYTEGTISKLEDKISRFLSGYLDSVNLSYSEINHMVDLYYWMQLSDTFCFEPNLCPRLDFSQLKAFGKYRISLIKWLAKNRGKIQKIVSTQLWQIRRKMNTDASQSLDADA